MSVSTRTVSWFAAPRDEPKERLLMGELGVPSLVAAMLVRRGYDTPDSAHGFLNPSLDHLHDPAKLPDYGPARDVILDAKDRGETFFVHGDYDVDGITSAALFHRFLTTVGVKVKTHVPHRMKEGYGIHLNAVDEAKEAGATVFLTCDCGSSAIEQIERARSYGMRVVVTDHHSIGEHTPDCQAFINPHREDSEYPFPELSGVGVAFKLCEGLTAELGIERAKFHRAFLDLAALGTIADVMPLVGENRVLAKFGLQRVLESKKPGIRALMQKTGLAERNLRQLDAYHVGFVLGPRLNAAGRIDDAAVALRLLLSQDDAESAELADRIETINDERRARQQQIIEEAVAMVEERGFDQRYVILVGKEDWHPGVIGIVAGKLVEQFRRPAFVASIDAETGECKASARTIPGFHLADTIRAHRHLLLGGGGHAMAAGCSFLAKDIEALGDAMHEYARGILTADDFVERYEVDLEVDPSEMTLPAVQALYRMAPFGQGNPEPMFLARGMQFSQITPTRNPLHMQAVLRTPAGRTVKCAAFNLGPRFENLSPGFTADVLFRACLEEWNGATYLKWHLKDFEIC